MMLQMEQGNAMKNKELVKRYRIARPSTFRLKDYPCDDVAGGVDKESVQPLLERNIERLSQCQERLYAQGEWSVLLVFQAMDAAGKDSTIKHVMTGINPQGCQVFSFKAPSSEELAHDFLWRCSRSLPERGRIGIFNRSYYEEVLVVRVHPELRLKQRLPPVLVTPRFWEHRFDSINHFEQHLARNGTLILKFFLHVSYEEQRERFLKRLDQPSKNWKFSADDIRERGFWKQYMEAYEEMIRHTSTSQAPWFVIPADHKWYSRLAVSAIVTEALERLNPAFPKVGREQREKLAAIERELQRQG